MSQLVSMRLQALEFCREQGWPESRLHDALERVGKSDEVVTSARSFWKAVPRPAHAVPLDVEVDREFFRQVMAAELEARAMDARALLFASFWRGVDAEGVSLALNVADRSVSAIEERHAATRPREGKGKTR